MAMNPEDGSARADLVPGTYRVLVVGGDHLLARLMKSILCDPSMEVLAASDCLSALAILGQTRVAVLVLDDRLAVRGGFAMVQHIRADPRWDRMPVLMVGSHTEFEFLNMAHSAGVDAHLAQPFAVEQAQSMVRELLAYGRRYAVGVMA